jgi:26S proteasome regulatory subunit N2
LEGEDVDLQAASLRKLARIVDTHWAEIADRIATLEALAEDDEFPEQQLAASVASRTFFHLEEYEDALRLALTAGALFDVEDRSEYTSALIARCIDSFAEQRVAALDAGEAVDVDERLGKIVARMLDRCFEHGEWKHAMGIALECRMMDVVERCLDAPDSEAEVADMLAFTQSAALQKLTRYEWRQAVLSKLAEKYKSLSNPDYLGMCRCLEFVGDSTAVSNTLMGLLRSGQQESVLAAYQVAFDVYEHSNQHFIVSVLEALPSESSEAADEASGEAAEADAEASARIAKVRSILDGSFPLRLQLDFLSRRNKADLLFLSKLKGAAEKGRANSVIHNSLVVAHAYMHAGTTRDTFLRDNLEWLGKANHWARFSATAGQGIIHKGHVKEAMDVLGPYLPQPGQGGQTKFSEGGALYALGLIHAGAGQSSGGQVVTYLSDALNHTHEESLQHGGALGIGLAAMGTGNDRLYAQLREILFSDLAVAGEGAAVGIGLLLLGRGPGWTSELTGMDAISEMLNYARATTHAKITRGLAMALALLVYGYEDQGNVLIDQMLADADPILRYGGAYAIAMAYAGTSSNAAVRKLLHVAVSDVSSDVRRAAVSALGFVLCSNPSQVPRIVRLLAQSYNPHVRYGACMALGVACAGTGDIAALDLLEPMLDDQVDFVRQGAHMALGMLLQQQPDGTERMKKLRGRFLTTVEDRHKPTLTKMGAIIGAGIMDAGGRNCVISLRSSTGFLKTPAVVGMALWMQHWYWFPYLHFLSLSMQPTTLIGLNDNLEMPEEFKPVCATKPSLFAYPEKMKIEKDDKKTKLVTVELSTTAKAKARAKRKAKMEGDAEMADEAPKAAKSGLTISVDTSAASGGSSDAAKPDTKEAPEPSSFVLQNPSRVTPGQRSFVQFPASGRFHPIAPVTSLSSGVVMLRDTTPGEAVTLVEVLDPSAHVDADEPTPPEPFIWTPPTEEDD